jgi:hypothetical protein
MEVVDEENLLAELAKTADLSTLEFAIRGMAGYFKMAPRKFKTRYWKLLESMEKLVDESEDEEISRIYHLFFQCSIDALPADVGPPQVPFMLTSSVRNELIQTGLTEREIDQIPIDVAFALAGKEVDEAPPVRPPDAERLQKTANTRKQQEVKQKAKTAGFFIKKIHL